MFGIALYYGKKTNQEQWEASNRQEQKRREREFNSGDKFVGHWLPHGGSYGLDVVKIGDGNLLVSVSKLGETIWTGKGIVQNYRLVFGGEGKGKKISGSLAYRAVSSISYELSGELTENGVLNALIVQKIE